MNRNEHPFDQLLWSAAHLTEKPEGPLSYRTMEVVIASWKAGASQADEPWNTAYYTPALAIGLVAVLVTLTLNYAEPALNLINELELPLMAFRNLLTL